MQKKKGNKNEKLYKKSEFYININGFFNSYFIFIIIRITIPYFFLPYNQQKVKKSKEKI